MKIKMILILAITFIILTLVYVSSAGNVINFAEGDQFDDYTLSEGSKLYIRFNAADKFNQLDIYVKTMQSGAETSVKLYPWDNSIPPKGTGEEIGQLNGKDTYAELTFGEKDPGEYVLCIEQVKKASVLRKYHYKRSKVNLYKDGYIENGSMDIKLHYTESTSNDLKDLSDYELPKHTAAPEPKEEHDPFAENIKPDTWTAVDGLGRTLPLYDTLYDKRKDKIVGIFYWTWHGELSKSSRARNITEIIKQYPEAINDFKHKAWQGYSGYHHWNEPLFGYYSTEDEYVLRKHAEMLADAGVDFIAFDCTNGSYTWTDSYMKLLKVFTEAKKDGVKVPKITFMSNFAAIESTWVLLKQIYIELYKPGLYNDLWFYLDGKPLMWAFPQAVPEDGSIGSEIKEFFTFRYPYAEGISPLDEKYSWTWAGTYPNEGYGKGKNGRYEQMALSIATNAGGPMNNPNAWGRSYSKSNYQSSYTYGGKKIVVNSQMENSVRYGIYIQEQWDYVLKKDPDVIFVCGWNEWVAIRHEEWGGYENAFPDQFIDEYSRDIEPSKGDLKDYYYYQLVANVRKFKGVSKPESYDAKNTIDIRGDISQWDKVKAVFNHYTNNTYKRDHAGYIGTSYKSDTMRNDIRTSKVAFDDNNIYFYVETVADLTSPSDENWMRLFIDTEFEGLEANWEGFEYIVNRVNPGEKCVVERSIGGWEWETIYEADYSIQGNVLQITIPREILSQKEGIPSFSFKWADNNCADGDILTLYTDGDAAPGGRFCFAFNVGNKEPGNIFIYVVIAAAALAVVASAVVIIVTKKRKGGVVSE